MSWAEAEWERPTLPIQVSPSDVNALLGALGPATRLTPLHAGKANTNLRIDRADGPPLVLRVYQRDPKALQREARLLEWVDGRVPTPTLRTQGFVDGHPAAVFDFVEGRSSAALLANHPEAADAIGHALGGTLAGLADLPIDGIGLYAPDLSLSRRFPSIRHSFEDLVRWSLRKGKAGRRLGKERSNALLSWLPTALARMEMLEAHPGLAHGDYKSANLLMRVEGPAYKVVAVLDWEFACPFTPMLDIAILMRHRTDWPDAFQHGFEEGYGMRAWLPADWRDLSRDVDVMNLVGFLNGSADRPRLYAHVVALLDDTIGYSPTSG